MAAFTLHPVLRVAVGGLAVLVFMMGLRDVLPSWVVAPAIYGSMLTIWSSLLVHRYKTLRRRPREDDAERRAWIALHGDPDRRDDPAERR
jgi:hypothetical protein